jgi:hypothetical protein
MEYHSSRVMISGLEGIDLSDSQRAFELFELINNKDLTISCNLAKKLIRINSLNKLTESRLVVCYI